MTPVALPPALQPLVAALAAAGLELAAPLNTAWYDQAVEPALRLPARAGWPARPEGRLALLVGSARGAWDAFAAACAASSQLTTTPDPFDTWVEEVVLGVLAAHSPASLGAPALGWARVGAPRLIAFGRLAVASGAAWLAPCHLTIHPELGPWHAWRAVLVWDQSPPPGPPPRLEDPCGACATGCAPAFQAALDAQAEGLGWLPPRDACPLGRGHRYASDAILYHYTGERRWLPQRDPSG